VLRTTTACLVSLVMLASSAAWAQDDGDYSRAGPYLGFDALLAIPTPSDKLDVSETGGLAGRALISSMARWAMTGTKKA